jgi:pimeloyl-ACP methyl ester carboxylesterase
MALAMRHGVVARRAVLIAPPADVRIFSDHFARTLAIPPAVQQTMHRNLERRLGIVWDELHIPTIVRELPAAALVIHDRDDADVPFAHGEEIVGAWAGSRLESTTGLGHRTLLRDPAVIAWSVEFLREGSAV